MLRSHPETSLVRENADFELDARREDEGVPEGTLRTSNEAGGQKPRLQARRGFWMASKQFKPRLGSGDAGLTDLFGGRRVKKTDLRIQTNALIDELSSLLGVIKARGGKDEQEITGIQRSLTAVSALIAGAGTAGQVKESVAAVEALIAGRSKKLPPLKEFILPGKNKKEALVHLARSRARLCELLAWRLKAKLPAVYLNRLSDYLFLLARTK